ncbi:hypothetical protein VNO78_02293 [Psophocarpus tetragonolobus]|uniref:Uncharacterized protein n=1 Tax=Psophocarpus tetragonolobus TaxID=3891 RepID=A0AAN9T1A8_PSOTE
MGEGTPSSMMMYHYHKGRVSCLNHYLVTLKATFLWNAKLTTIFHVLDVITRLCGLDVALGQHEPEERAPLDSRGAVKAELEQLSVLSGTGLLVFIGAGIKVDLGQQVLGVFCAASMVYVD